MAKLKKKQPSGSGCTHLIVVGIVGCLLLFINLLIVGSFMRINQSLFQEVLTRNESTNVRISQAIMFFLGVLMVLVEYWIFDYLCDKYTKPDSLVSTDNSES